MSEFPALGQGYVIRIYEYTGPGLRYMHKCKMGQGYGIRLYERNLGQGYGIHIYCMSTLGQGYGIRKYVHWVKVIVYAYKSSLGQGYGICIYEYTGPG